VTFISYSAGLISPRTVSVGLHLATKLLSTKHGFHDWMVFQFLDSLEFCMTVELKDGQEHQKVEELQSLSF
jgi:hypothetical protein